jgi:phage terminase large subunit-like protein
MATADSAVDAGVQNASPYKEQQPFMGLDKRFYGFISGTGAGKTFAGVYRLWLNADWLNPNSMGAIIVPDKAQFTDNIKPIMEEFGLVGPGDQGVWEYQSVYTDEPGLHTHNNQRILILSADNQRQIGRIKGKNLGYWWMDEEAEIDPRAREIAQQRLRVGQYPNGFITTTPEGKNHTWEFFENEVQTEKRPHGRGTIYEGKDRLAVVGVPPEANPAIRDEDIANMRASLPDAIVAQEIEGEFVEIGSGVFTRDMLEFIEPSDLSDRSYRYVVGVDVGVEADSQKARDNDSDYWAASLLMVDTMQPYAYLIDCQRERGMSLSQGVTWIQGLVDPLPDGSTKVYVESNAAQRWFKDALSDAGLNAHAVMNTTKKEERIIQMSIPLERGQVKFVNRDIDEKLGYDPRFQNLISELLSFPEGSHDDMADSLQIAIDNVDLGGHNVLGGEIYDRGET